MWIWLGGAGENKWGAGCVIGVRATEDGTVGQQYYVRSMRWKYSFLNFRLMGWLVCVCVCVCLRSTKT